MRIDDANAFGQKFVRKRLCCSWQFVVRWQAEEWGVKFLEVFSKWADYLGMINASFGGGIFRNIQWRTFAGHW